MELWKEFTFEAAHRLEGLPDGHKCGRLHGHSYRLTVHVRGQVDAVTGMVIDFADVKAAVKPIVDEHLDHFYLNDIADLGNPTAENLARWLWARIKPALPGLSKIEVRETCTCGVAYHGEDEV
jgi:6-pyruvoyltetrahydropterin/6-carboxytetrahydropterin synthase